MVDPARVNSASIGRDAAGLEPLVPRRIETPIDSAPGGPSDDKSLASCYFLDSAARLGPGRPRRDPFDEEEPPHVLHPQPAVVAMDARPAAGDGLGGHRSGNVATRAQSR